MNICLALNLNPDLTISKRTRTKANINTKRDPEMNAVEKFITVENISGFWGLESKTIYNKELIRKGVSIAFANENLSDKFS